MGLRNSKHKRKAQNLISKAAAGTAGSAIRFPQQLQLQLQLELQLQVGVRLELWRKYVNNCFAAQSDKQLHKWSTLIWEGKRDSNRGGKITREREGGQRKTCQGAADRQTKWQLIQSAISIECASGGVPSKGCRCCCWRRCCHCWCCGNWKPTAEKLQRMCLQLLK